MFKVFTQWIMSKPGWVVGYGSIYVSDVLSPHFDDPVKILLREFAFFKKRLGLVVIHFAGEITTFYSSRGTHDEVKKNSFLSKNAPIRYRPSRSLFVMKKANTARNPWFKR